MSKRFTAHVFAPVYELEEALDSLIAYDILKDELDEIIAKSPQGEEFDELNEQAKALLQSKREQTACSLGSIASQIDRPLIMDIVEKVTALSADPASTEPDTIALRAVPGTNRWKKINLQPVLSADGTREEGQLQPRIARVRAVMEREVPGYEYPEPVEVEEKGKDLRVPIHRIGEQVIRIFSDNIDQPLTKEELVTLVEANVSLSSDDEKHGASPLSLTTIALGNLFDQKIPLQVELMRILQLHIQMIHRIPVGQKSHEPLKGKAQTTRYVARRRQEGLRKEGTYVIRGNIDEPFKIVWGQISPPIGEQHE